MPQLTILCYNIFDESGDTMKRCAIIYNPNSGRKLFASKLDHVIKRVEQAGYDVTVYATKRPRHATEITKDVCDQGYDLLIVSGGDGTVHEVINGLCKKEKRIQIGYIPSGTACDLASTLKIPKNIDKALDIILNGVSVKMDIVNTNKGFFIYVAAIGTYVDISYVTDSKLKKRIGYLSYLITGVKEFFTIPMIKAKIKHDKGVLKGHFSLILVVNSKKVAGFNMIDKPQLDDGYVDVVTYRYIPFLNNLLFFISFIITPKVIPGVRKFKTKSLRVITEHHHTWNMDGEEENSGTLRLDVEKQAIDIIVDKEVRRKYFKENYHEYKKNQSE